MLLPNIGREILDYAASWGLNGFVLSGGGDFGDEPIRDETEFALLNYAMQSDLPLIGICRGLQVLQVFHGGVLGRCPAEGHVARLHPIRFTDSIPLADLKGTTHVVNSFHNYGIRVDDVCEGLEPTAITGDGWVEAAQLIGTRTSGVMWHPERHRPFCDVDRRLFRHVFDLDVSE